ncbi:MAG: class I SAM-dependent rRNA methyltransferase [Spirochaetaceae bacterium]|nr:class I SAM-dependent rRNA methyltransferase [Spirochaetaceae bacterium]
MRMPTIILKPKEELRIRQGHPWIYDNEIATLEGDPAPGDEVRVLDSRKKLLGFAFFNPNSKIRARIFSHTDEHADAAFFAGVFKFALAWRQKFFNLEEQSVRMVFGEADSVPGLIVDRYVGKDEATGKAGTWLSTQFLSLGAEVRKPLILKALADAFQPDGVAERSDAPVRALEGLVVADGVLAGSVPDSIIIKENEALFSVSLLSGQKTGWFLDQRANRGAAARLAKGRRVLDVFCNQGGFGIACALQGATSVQAVDSSREALAAAQHNARLNGVSDRVVTTEANAFDFLHEIEKSGEKFDMVILDPPAFAKSRATVKSAWRGYKEINVRALRLLQPGGVLVTCSCSYWFGDSLFDAMLAEAASDCRRRYRLIESRVQDLDHPIVSGYDESHYLKCRIVAVI